jgi:hypothetical protein
MMDVAFHLPLFGQKKLHRIFVLGGQDVDGLRGINAQAREGVVKHLANLFELVCNLAAFFFARIGIHGEVRTPHFDPIVSCVCRKRAEKKKERKRGGLRAP